MYYPPVDSLELYFDAPLIASFFFYLTINFLFYFVPKSYLTDPIPFHNFTESWNYWKHAWKIEKFLIKKYGRHSTNFLCKFFIISGLI